MRPRITLRLLVKAAPPLIRSVPAGGVASMRVTALTDTSAFVPASDAHGAAVWHEKMVIR